MGNRINLNKTTPISESLKMSNGLTSVFISVFGLSGSRLAQTDQEKRLIVWVMEKNQSFLGIGNVDFEICDMPWNSHTFDNDKIFIFSVLDSIKNKLGWETLDYNPREESVFSCVDSFRSLLDKMTVKDINREAIEEWERYLTIWEAKYKRIISAESREYEKQWLLPCNPISRGFPRCEKHDVLLSIFGCHVCTDC